MRPWSLALTVAITALGMAGEFRSPINGDAAWLLHAAGRVLDGDRLYVDLLETNPPLAVWLKLPVVAGARLAGASPITVYRLFVLALALGSTLACTLLLARALPSPKESARSIFPLAVALVLFVLPAPFFGQREHLALALALPYLVASASAYQAARLGLGAETLVGAAAAVGLALKPPFLIIWAGVLAYGLLRQRRLRAMDLCIAVSLVIYALAVVLITPEFLRLAWLLGEPFLQYSRRPVLVILTQNTFAWSAILTLLLYIAVRGIVRHSVLADHLAIGVAGFLLALVIQGKGYGYHYLPALGTSIILLAVILSGASESRRPLLRAAAVVGAATLMLGGSAFLVHATARRAAGKLSAIDREMVETAEFVSARAAGAQVAVLSSRLADAFPMMLYTRAHWALRFPNLWFAQVYGRRSEPGALPGSALWSVRTVAEDLERRRPALILVRRPEAGGGLDADLDYVRFLSQDVTFRCQFSRYRQTGNSGPFLVYQRQPVSSCRVR